MVVNTSYTSNMPPLIKARNLTTPSTMSPLFPSSSHSQNVGNTIIYSPKTNGSIIDGCKSASVVNKHISNNTISTLNTEE